jgi:RHS repeat-associated protein
VKNKANNDYFGVTAAISTSAGVLERYGYDGFGTPRYMTSAFGNRSSSSYEWETLFDAYRYDLESGLYQVRYRYLHPKLGRWVSRDPIGELGGVSLYAYVINSPIRSTDTFGLFKACVDWDARDKCVAEAAADRDETIAIAEGALAQALADLDALTAACIADCARHGPLTRILCEHACEVGRAPQRAGVRALAASVIAGAHVVYATAVLACEAGATCIVPDDRDCPPGTSESRPIVT